MQTYHNKRSAAKMNCKLSRLHDWDSCVQKKLSLFGILVVACLHGVSTHGESVMAGKRGRSGPPGDKNGLPHGIITTKDCFEVIG